MSVKISELPPITDAGEPELTDIFPEVQPATGGTTYKTTFDQLFNLFSTTLLSSDLDMNNNRIINLANPSTPQDAATKTYADNPSIPFVRAYSASVQVDVTGDGTISNVNFGTVLEDKLSNFNGATGTFTAPISGYYFIHTNINLELVGTSSAYNTVVIQFVSSNTANSITVVDEGIVATQPVSIYKVNGTGCVKMAANDTLNVALSVFGGLKNVDIGGGNFGGGVNTNVVINYMSS